MSFLTASWCGIGDRLCLPQGVSVLLLVLSRLAGFYYFELRGRAGVIPELRS